MDARIIPTITIPAIFCGLFVLFVLLSQKVTKKEEQRIQQKKETQATPEPEQSQKPEEPELPIPALIIHQIVSFDLYSDRVEETDYDGMKESLLDYANSLFLPKDQS